MVNDGAPCNLSDSFFAAAHPTNGHAIVTVPGGSSIGEKRNIGAAAVPEADYIASWDDDDFSLPHRLSAHLRAMGDGAVWLSASRKYISITTLDHVVGFEFGRCFGAGMVAKCVVDALPWPHISWCEDQRLYEKVRADARFGGGRGATTGGGPIIDDDTLTYVQRRHDANVSAPRRESMWQGVMPLQLAGSDDAIRVVETVKSLLARWRVDGVHTSLTILRAERERALVISCGGSFTAVSMHIKVDRARSARRRSVGCDVGHVHTCTRALPAIVLVAVCSVQLCVNHTITIHTQACLDSLCGA